MSDVQTLMNHYGRGLLPRREFVRRLLALGVSLTAAETFLEEPLKHALAAPALSLPSRAPRLVLLVFDAFRQDYQHLASMPNLNWLMNRGTTFGNAWVGQLESMTPASHATLSTGAMPAHHGIIGFSWRDPTSGREVYGAWLKGVLAGRLEQQMRQHNVNSIPQAVKATDPSARVVAVSSEKYYAADALGGPAADYIMYGLPQNGTITPRGIPHHVPPETLLKRADLHRRWPLRYGQYDELSMTMALESLRALDPRVLMINLPGCDTYGHKVGGPANPTVMAKLVAACDLQLGRLIREYIDRGIFDQTIFVITGDHGMIPNTYQVQDTRIKEVIRAAGGDYLFHTGGSAAFIWLRNSQSAPAVAQKLADQIPHVLFAHYLTVQSGAYQYHPVVPSGRVADPALGAAYQYLLSTIESPIAPDIVLSLEENMVVRNKIDGGTLTGAHGNHSGATWGVQQVPLVMAGPGIKAGAHSDFPARLMDVAPTVLTLMGIAPDRMDGVPLVDALLTPTAVQQKASDTVAPSLTAYQQALVKRSQADAQMQKARGPNKA